MNVCKLSYLYLDVHLMCWHITGLLIHACCVCKRILEILISLFSTKDQM